MIEVIKDKKEWNKQLALFEDLDLYHTYDYHYLSKRDNESPILIKYTEGATVLVLPLLLRDINNSDFKDATSVYGYAGTLSLNVDESFQIENFHNDLNAFFYQNKIISVFSRLHPFLEQEEKILEGLGIIAALGKVVYVDLTDTLENQRAKYNRRLKTYLNKSRKSCTVIDGNIEDHMAIFVDLYKENMRRVDADDSYFFDDDYYHKILSSEDFESELKLCVHNESQTIIGAAIFLKKGNIVQYHLSGYSEENFDVDPIKLIIDEMRIKATGEGFKYFNLGGGLGSTEDSLFRFKSGFSKSLKEFKIWKYIVDEEAYEMLTDKFLGAGVETGFFPAYRSKA